MFGLGILELFILFLLGDITIGGALVIVFLATRGDG